MFTQPCRFRTMFILLCLFVILFSVEKWLVSLIKSPKIIWRPQLLTTGFLKTVPVVDKKKKILIWYENYRVPKVGPACPIWRCEITGDRTVARVETYDAIVFHLRSWTLTDIPIKRSPHQRYVFLNMESPAWRMLSTWKEIPAGFFNWTMTYRRDSDVVNPYGLFSKKSANETFKVNYAKGKTKLVAWFVSNCASHSGRMEFVKELQRFVNVDVYGQCGTHKCPKSQQDNCRKMLDQDYKFYLALENSLCVDYVTEKFFDHASHNIIPVVFDLHGHLNQTAPPHSFINAADFPSVGSLADYLFLLNNNDTLYNEYFDWKENYVVHDAQGGMCRLCEGLYAAGDDPKVYDDMGDWWEKKARCRTLHFTNDVWQDIPLSL